MSSYKYEVITPAGKPQTGTIEAASLEQVSAELKAGGNTIVSITLANALNKDIDIHIGKAVSARELSVFCRQFQSVLKAGVTIIDALEMLSDQTENKTFKTALLNIRDDVQRGETLAGAMQKFPKIFPPIMIHMMEAGEASGSLEGSFERMGEHFEKDAHLKSLIIRSMIYPIILIIVIIVVVIIMMTKIVPTFTASFAEVGAGELPMITRVVMGISDFIVQKGLWILIGVVLAVLALREFGKSNTGAQLYGKLMLKLPLVGQLSIKTAAARFTRTLSTLMSSGIKLVDGVHIVKQMMGNVIVRNALDAAEEEVNHGIPLSKPLEESGVFPPMVYHMIGIGEETGNMEEMLDKIADYYDEEVEAATAALLSAMEPLIIVVMALIVVPIILAIMMPMYSMYNAIG